MALVVAAPEMVLKESRSIPRRTPPTRVPAGRVHAYDTDERRVLCGVDHEGMTILDEQPWERGIFTRCVDCQRQATALSPG